MAAPRGKVAVTPPAVSKGEELPIIECFGLAKTPQGWVVVSVSVQGDRVVERQVVAEPESLAFATQRAQSQLVAQYLKPKNTV